jgi:hypothetical protein
VRSVGFDLMCGFGLLSLICGASQAMRAAIDGSWRDKHHVRSMTWREMLWNSDTTWLSFKLAAWALFVSVPLAVLGALLWLLGIALDAAV